MYIHMYIYTYIYIYMYTDININIYYSNLFLQVQMYPAVYSDWSLCQAQPWAGAQARPYLHLRLLQSMMVSCVHVNVS